MYAIFTDLDGSLHDHHVGVHARAYQCLQQLAELGVLRVIITGRSFYSACKVLPPDFPIDYLVFSSGAGIVHWPTQNLIRRFDMQAEESQAVRSFLQQQEWDFMVQARVPENHFFSYHQYSASNQDFEERLRIYSDFADPVDWVCDAVACSQYLVIARQEDTLSYLAQLRQQFSNFNIIRATSPLDGRSGWLEIFPKMVSKSQAAQWFCDEMGVRSGLAFGNDYNDLDLLHWADMSFVVENAPADLVAQFSPVASAAEGGFAEAVKHWLETH